MKAAKIKYQIRNYDMNEIGDSVLLYYKYTLRITGVLYFLTNLKKKKRKKTM